MRPSKSMKNTTNGTSLILRAPLLLLLPISIFSFQLSAFAQSSAFTYQGRLNDGPNPANGIYDLQFTIYDAVSSGAVQGGPLTNAMTALTNGLFTVTLDFGATPFTGA